MTTTAVLDRRSCIVFDVWDIGHHSQNPGPIRISGPQNGHEILRLITRTQDLSGREIYARMLSRTGKCTYWCIRNEKVYECGDGTDYYYTDERWED